MVFEIKRLRRNCPHRTRYKSISKSPQKTSISPAMPDTTNSSTRSFSPPAGDTGAAGLLDARYATERRQQLDIINKLQSLGATLDFDIPQIVVIGSQSAGKSSLIESISGITLPRASGTCTRCPTECRLINSTTPWTCKVSIRYLVNEFGERLHRVKEELFGDLIHNPVEVEERVRRAQRAALNPAQSSSDFLKNTDNPDHNALDFTMNSVCLEIQGENLTDLSFCDLPGLIASVSDGGNDDDIEKVKELVSSYISRPSCIILLTISCETDFETQGAYRLAKQHDKDGTRTIGVLTKPDRIETLDETKKWLELLKNERSKLSHGWFCVKQPNSDELKRKMSFEEAHQLGENFFMNTAPWSTLEATYKRQLGTSNLTRSLNEHLLNLISKRFPELMEELVTKLTETETELDSLPPPPGPDPVFEIMCMVGNFIDEVFKDAEGFMYDISGDTNSEDINMHNNHFVQLREVYDEFRNKIQKTAPKFRPFGSGDVFETTEYRNVAASIEEHIFDEGDPNESIIYLDDIVREVELATTRALPGHYPSVVVKKLIAKFTRKWEQPAHLLIESVYRIVLKHNCDIVEKHFRNFTSGGLRQKILRIVQDFTQKHRDKANKRVKWLLVLESDPFTLNRHYFDTHREKHFVQLTAQRNQFLINPRAVPAQKQPQAWDLNQHALEAMATVRAYFQVAYMRVVDNLPLAIDRELVRLKKRSLQKAITHGLHLTGPNAHDSDACARLLAEPVETARRRKDLTNKRTMLLKARDELFSAL